MKHCGDTETSKPTNHVLQTCGTGNICIWYRLQRKSHNHFYIFSCKNEILKCQSKVTRYIVF